MELYHALYLILFNAITDALDQQELQNFGRAKELLVQAQQIAEQRLIETGD